MAERRYNRDEVAAIFKQAAESQQAPRLDHPSAGGMTLAELQEIGSEVGLPRELVARAARSLDVTGSSALRTFIGLPIGVSRTVELERSLSDAEWERLVVQLRDTFDARGRVRYDGPFRQWTNGNLQVLLEPTPSGHRLRLRTVKGSARELMSAGLVSLAIAAAMLLAAATTGRLADLAAGAAFLTAAGLGLFGLAALGLPGWARLRGRQMDDLAEWLVSGTRTATPAGRRPEEDDPTSPRT